MSLRKKSKISTEFNMSSMTDIIFLLIILFIVTSSVTRESVLKVVLPKARPTDNMVKKTIKLSVTADKQYAVDQNIVSLEDLPFALQEALNANPEAVVSVHGDKKVEYEEVMNLVKIADDKGAKVVLALDKEAKK